MNLAVVFSLVLVLAGTAFQLGGVAPGAGPAFVVLAGVLGAIQGFRGARNPRTGDRSLVLVLALASFPLAVGAVELIPLPRAVIRAAAPRTAELYDRDEAIALAPATARPISVEPGTSRRALARGFALLALFLVAASAARHQSDARTLAIALVALAGLIAVHGLVQGEGPGDASNPWRGRARSPFFNPNNFASYLEIALPLAVGLALARPVLPSRSRPVTGIVTFLGERPDLVIRLGALAAAGLLLAGATQSRSRAALGAIAVGLLVTATFSGALRRRHLVPLTGLLVALSLGAAWVNAGAAAARFGSTPDDLRSRIVHWQTGIDTLRGRTLTGGGLGTFDALSFAEITSSVFARSGLLLLPERAHNDYLNLATDLGIPAAILGIAGALGAALVVARRLRRDNTEKTLSSERRALGAGALGGVAAALAHSFFDFGLEIPAVGGAFAVTFGLAWALARGHEHEGERRTASRTARAALAGLALLLAAVGVRDLVAERSAAVSAELEKRLPQDASPATIREATSACVAALGATGDDFVLAERHAHLLRRQGDYEGALAPARAAARLAPARAKTQGSLALALIAAGDLSTQGPAPDAARLTRARARRKEGEERLLFALELAPCYPELLFSAGMVFLDRAAETNARVDVDRALACFLDAARYQVPDPGNADFLALARRRVDALSKERGLLGPFCDELGKALTTRPTEAPREGGVLPRSLARVCRIYMRGNGIRRGATLLCLLLGLLAGRAAAEDQRQKLEMRGGERIEGRILAVTHKHVLIDVAGGQRFVDRAQVERAVEADGTRVDLASRETESTRDVVGLVVTQFNQEKIRVTRGETSFEPTSISTERGITNALIRVRDELRTGPWSRAQLAIPGGAQLTAQNNAVIRFGDNGPLLLRGSVRLKEGDFSLEIPEGRASGHGVDILADHTRDRTQLTCYQGTCRVEGEGWHLDLHKNHTVDVANGQNERAPYIAANGANSFPVDLQVAGKWIQIQPGEKVCLVVLGTRSAAPEGQRPETRPEPRRDDEQPFAQRPAPTQPQPWTQTPTSTGVGRVIKADAPFWQTRSGQAPFKVAPEAAANTVLKANDEISTEDGRATLAFDESTFDLNVHTALVIYPEDLSVAGLFRLKRGEARAATAGKVVVAVPTGEVTVVDGGAVLAVTNGSVTLWAEKGRAVLSCGKDVKAEIPTGSTVTATVSEGKTKVEASGTAAFVHAANVDASLGPRRAIEVGRADDGVSQVTLWNNAHLELEGSLTARIEETEAGLVAVLSDGRRVPLEPGVILRLRPLAPPTPRDTGSGWLRDPTSEPRPNVDPPLPTPPDPTRFPVPAPSHPSPPRLERAGTETRTLSNGAILTLINWGTLKERPSQNDFVEIEGPGGSPVLVGPRTRLTLTRKKGGLATVSTDDKRVLTWSEGTQTSTFTYRIASDGKLSIDLVGDRSLVVDAGASFELELRADGLIHAELVQQTVYVKPGEHLLVNRAGYHTEHSDMAKVSPGSK